MAADRKEPTVATQKKKAERVKVKGPNGRTVTLSKGAADSLLKNKAEYTRVGSTSSAPKS